MIDRDLFFEQFERELEKVAGQRGLGSAEKACLFELVERTFSDRRMDEHRLLAHLEQNYPGEAAWRDEPTEA